MSALLLATMIACAPAIQRAGGAPSAAQLVELWIGPGPTPRDLFAGPGGNASVRPATDARFDVVKRDTRGFSITYRVHDERGRAWSLNIGPEAQTEAVASRMIWALGSHELPSYFVERWIDVEHAKGSMLGGAPFRNRAANDVARIRQKITEGLKL